MALQPPSYSSDCIKCADLSMLLDLNGFTLHLSPANRASSAWLDGCNRQQGFDSGQSVAFRTFCSRIVAEEMIYSVYSLCM